MTKIHFKNGDTKIIPKELSDTIAKRILEGCNTFQVFKTKEDDFFLIINISDISYID